MVPSGLWLVRVRWNGKGSLKSPGQRPTIDKTVAEDASFIASGRRHESDNYLFLGRADAESFKEGIEETLKRRVSAKWKAKTDIVEVTPEDVAHMDLEPARHKWRNTSG
jgi:hypothetical protein